MEAGLVCAGEEGGDGGWSTQGDACRVGEGELGGEVVKGGVCVAEAVEEDEDGAWGSGGRWRGNEDGRGERGMGGEVGGGWQSGHVDSMVLRTPE